MNATLKTVLLTVLTLSIFTLTLIELSGVSNKALFNKYGIGKAEHEHVKPDEKIDDQAARDAKVKDLPKTTMEVLQVKHDFGAMTEGDIVSHTWVVKNTGKNPLMISNIETSCGCTAPTFTKEPILPGQEGKVTLEFNSAGKAGNVHKNALIISNAEIDRFSIGFTAQVAKK
ncbi:MAG: DUF1573 domain-containing protein [Chitinophagaceae bacterium]